MKRKIKDIASTVEATIMVPVVKKYGLMARQLPVSGAEPPRVTAYERRRDERRKQQGEQS